MTDLNNTASEVLKQASGEPKATSNAGSGKNPSFEVKTKSSKKQQPTADAGSQMQVAKSDSQKALRSKSTTYQRGVKASIEQGRGQANDEGMAFLAAYSKHSAHVWGEIENVMDNLHGITVSELESGPEPEIEVDVEEGGEELKDFFSSFAAGILPGGRDSEQGSLPPGS